MSFLKSLSGVFGKGKGEKQSSYVVSPEEKKMLLDKIRQSELFKQLPPKNMEEMFAHMETVEMMAGDVVIKEGEEGDYYYLMVRGKANVMRRKSEGEKPQFVAELNEPKGFGEEALISNAKRNATIMMATDGILMRLSKDAFNDHVKEPMLDWLSPAQAQDMVAKGGKWLDVRPEAQAKQSHLHGAISIPIEELRTRLGELDKNTQYICYCDNARISSSAAFIMRQFGYKALVLRGGLQALSRAGGK